MRTIPLELNGLTDVPAGKIAAVVTYFQMLAPRPPRALPPRPDLALRRLEAGEARLYRDLFRRVGEPWLWFSRARMSEAELTALLRRAWIEVLVVERGGEPVGLAELDRSLPGESKISFFGLVAEATGTGAAQFLMDAALGRAWSAGVRRVWLHTCTLDHPAAIRFYAAEGFSAYRLAIEVADDPRLTGAMPPTAAPHLPVIR